MGELNLKEFLKNKKRVFLYGTGKSAKKIKTYMEFYFRKIDGWVVSDGFEYPEKVLEGLPVYKASEVPCTKQDGIIIGVSRQFYNEVVPSLIAGGYNNIYFPSNKESWIGEMMGVLDSLDVGLGNEYLEIRDFKVVNMFKQTDNILTLEVFIHEMCDLALPLFNINGYIDEGPYEYDQCVLEKDDVVLDCGANIGMFSAQAAAKGCEVHAFEPSLTTIEYLEITRKIYRDEIIVAPYALADYEGTTYFMNCIENIGGSSFGIIENYPSLAEKIEVDVTTIDSYVKKNNLQRVDFIKSDIEGAECSMLRGAKETLKNYEPKLALCTYHNIDDINTMTDLILEANPNYKIRYAYKKLYAWVDKDNN